MTFAPLRTTVLLTALLATMGSAALAGDAGKPHAAGKPSAETTTRADQTPTFVAPVKSKRSNDYSAIIHSPFGAVERNFESGRR